MSEPIINKVAESSLVTLDLEAFYPRLPVVTFDIRPFLFMELILKEKEFRQQLQEHDWEQYKGKIVAITCSAAEFTKLLQPATAVRQDDELAAGRCCGPSFTFSSAASAAQ